MNWEGTGTKKVSSRLGWELITKNMLYIPFKNDGFSIHSIDSF